MSTDVQTMAHLDGAGGPSAMQTPLYPIVSLFGLLMVVGTFLTWASSSTPNGGAALSATGLDAGGWGLAALITGVVIAALGVLGYFWNPFSDPEAVFIAGFGLAAIVASLIKIADPTSLFSGGQAEAFEDFGASASAGIGLWLVLIGALLAFLSGIWILYSRPRATAA